MLYLSTAELPSLAFEMIYRNATTHPSDCMTAEDACSGDRTPWMFSEAKKQAQWRFYLLQ